MNDEVKVHFYFERTRVYINAPADDIGPDEEQEAQRGLEQNIP